MKTSCELIYDITGIAHTDDPELLQEFCNEIRSQLDYVVGLVATRSGDNSLRLTIQVNDIKPFSKDNFESFVFDQIWDSTIAYFEMSDKKTVFDLVSQRFE